MNLNSFFSSIKEFKSSKISLEHSFIDYAASFIRDSGTVLLLSGGDQATSRKNILALFPKYILTYKDGLLLIKGDTRNIKMEVDPFSFLKDILALYKTTVIPEQLPAVSGLFGYLAYDLKHSIENIPRMAVDDLDLPDLHLIIPQAVVIQDLAANETNVHRTIFNDTSLDDAAYIENRINTAVNFKYIPEDYSVTEQKLNSNFQKNEYKSTISSIIDYIKAGDIYQVNMSQRFSASFEGSSFALFNELFNENPASFFAYMQCLDHNIISTSPERFIKQEGSAVEARPIKGTRPRGLTGEEDSKLKTELLKSKKDDAELSMIVDLLRNDMGKVCKAGSVKVINHKILESYKNVHHLVSIIEGSLENDKNSIDLIKAAFPGGSITGCPKIRAMEIIEEKEPYHRHIYTGSIGYIGFNNRMDLSIAIRTATVFNNTIFFSAGGGIVFDSEPEEEYLETLHKAETFSKVLRTHIKSVPEEHFVWHNGKIIPEKNCFIPLSSRGYQYGRGVFETILAKDGKIIDLNAHIIRLVESCKKILDIKLPELSWIDIIFLLLSRNKLLKSTASVKIIISSGKDPEGFNNFNLSIIAKRYIHRLEKSGKDGLDLGIYPNPRGNFLFNHKTNNYLFNLLAGEWARSRGYDEAVILNHDGTVAETNTGNIILIRDKTVIQPETDFSLPGIMEKKVLKELLEKGYTITVKPVFPEELEQTSVFVTNSLIGMIPVLSVNRGGEG